MNAELSRAIKYDIGQQVHNIFMAIKELEKAPYRNRFSIARLLDTIKNLKSIQATIIESENDSITVIKMTQKNEETKDANGNRKQEARTANVR